MNKEYYLNFTYGFGSLSSTLRGEQSVCLSMASAQPHNPLQPQGHLLPMLLPALTFLISVPWSQEGESDCCSSISPITPHLHFYSRKLSLICTVKWKGLKPSKGLGKKINQIVVQEWRSSEEVCRIILEVFCVHWSGWHLNWAVTDKAREEKGVWCKVTQCS